MSHKKGSDTLHDPEWLQRRYVDEKKTMLEIAREVGCSVTAVSRVLRLCDIPVRDMSEAKMGRPVLPYVEDLTDQSGRRLQYQHQVQEALKNEMFAAYGGSCACCGETESTFLSLDHVNGQGHVDRARNGGAIGVIRKLKIAGWPQDGYRVLCMNCQFGTKLGKTCPHKAS